MAQKNEVETNPKADRVEAILRSFFQSVIYGSALTNVSTDQANKTLTACEDLVKAVRAEFK